MALKIGFIGEEVNITIRQGADYEAQFTLEDSNGVTIDLTGRVYTAIMRKTPKSSAITASFVCELTNPTGGVFTMSMSNAVTATIPAGDTLDAQESQYVWEMEMLGADNKIYPVYYGKVSVFRQLTR